MSEKLNGEVIEGPLAHEGEAEKAKGYAERAEASAAKADEAAARAEESLSAAISGYTFRVEEDGHLWASIREEESTG